MLRHISLILRREGTFLPIPLLKIRDIQMCRRYIITYLQKKANSFVYNKESPCSDCRAGYCCVNENPAIVAGFN